MKLCSTSILVLALGVVPASRLAAQLVRGPELVLNSKKAGPQWQVDVATAANGNFIAVWTSGGRDGTPSNVIARVFSANGNPRTPEIPVSSADRGLQSHPAVAASANGDFVVVWQSQQASSSRIRGQLFTADGKRVGKHFTLPNPNYGYNPQSEPDVARAADGRFAVVWTELRGFVEPPDFWPLSNIFVRRFTADGRPIARPFLVSAAMEEGSGGVEFEPAVAMNASGAFVICWTDVSTDPSANAVDDIYAALFSPQGRDIASFYVNPEDTSIRFQNNATVAMANDGGFVVVWEDDAADGDPEDFSNSTGIRGQRYAADHSPQGETFHVNTTLEGSQISPSVALAPDGGFLVVWGSPQDGDGAGIVARRFAADGTPLSDEILLNDYTVGPQSLPAVAISPNGRGGVVWQSMDRDGDDFGVAARRVSMPPR